MLTGMRSRLLLFCLALTVATTLPIQAQINGVPASVTSLGFGGSTNPNPGVRASVTSLGPNGYGNNRPFFGDCCANFFWPVNPVPGPSSGHHRRRDRDRARDKDADGHRDHNFVALGVEPVYVPYAAAEDEESDDDVPDIDYSRGAGPLSPDSSGERKGTHKSMAYAEPARKADRPVSAQPATVLVFKDGHRSEVLNYAVVGDMLFDFAADRTHKVPLADLDLAATQKTNEDRGVDFQIPAAATP